MKALVIYIPAIHSRYINFLKQHSEKSIFLIDNSLSCKFPRMERDIRALDANDVLKALSGMGFLNIDILKEENISILEKMEEITLLDEEISYSFSERYLKGKNVKFITYFLRWDKDATEKKEVILPSKEISNNQFHKEIMKEAFVESEKSPDWWRQIGAILVKDEKIILKGFNSPLPSSDAHNILGDPRSNFDYGLSFEISKFVHAEASIIAISAKIGISLKGTSIYVTTFPCPFCAKLIALSGIKKVYYTEGYSLLDGEDILKSFNVEIIRVSQP